VTRKPHSYMIHNDWETKQPNAVHIWYMDGSERHISEGEPGFAYNVRQARAYFKRDAERRGGRAPRRLSEWRASLAARGEAINN
jgi:hypothetical protein